MIFFALSLLIAIIPLIFHVKFMDHICTSSVVYLSTRSCFDNWNIICYTNYQDYRLFVGGIKLARRSAPEKEPGAALRKPVYETLTKRLGYLISRTAAHIRLQTATLFEPLGIIPPQYLILATLDSEGPQTQKALGQRLKIDPTTMVSLIDDLEQKKLVSREKNLKDRRAYLVTLTASGKTLYEGSDKQLDLLEDELLAALSKSERETLRRLLTRLYMSFSPEDIRAEMSKRFGKESKR